MQRIYPINALPRAIPICLGKQSEYGARPVSIDIAAWLGKWPDMVASVQPVRPGETESYPATDVTRDGSIVTWTPSAYDTEHSGGGTLEIVGLVEGVKIISATAATSIEATSTDVSKEPEEPIAAWADAVIRAGEEAKQSASIAVLSVEKCVKYSEDAQGYANNSQSYANDAKAHADSVAGAVESVTQVAQDAAFAADRAEQAKSDAAGYVAIVADSAHDANMAAADAGKSSMAARESAQMAQDAAQSITDTTDALTTQVNDLTGQVGIVSKQIAGKAPAIVVTTSGDPAVIANAAGGAALSVVSHIGPTQFGSGDPSRDNVRDFVGYGSIMRYHSDSHDVMPHEVLTDTLPETVYGGTLDWVTGKLTITHVCVDMDTLYLVTPTIGTSSAGVKYATIRTPSASTETAGLLCNCYRTHKQNNAPAANLTPCVRMSGTQLLVYDNNLPTDEDSAIRKEKIEKMLEDLAICYPVTPRTVQLTPHQIEMLVGSNALWSRADVIVDGKVEERSTGITDVSYAIDTKTYIDTMIATIVSTIINT